MTFARLVLAASVNDPLPEYAAADRFDLPPRQQAYGIAQYYMTTVYSLFPAFPETAILSLLDALYQERANRLKSTDAWLLWMSLAIGSAAQSQRVDDEAYVNGQKFALRALSYADRALMPGYITQIQSLLLLAQYAMVAPAHFDSWSLIGFTSRAVIDLGFHQDVSQGGGSSSTMAQEDRRRLFYCVYSLDRWARVRDKRRRDQPTDVQQSNQHGSCSCLLLSG